MITEAVNKRVSSQIRYVTPVRQSSVTGITAELYQQIKEDFMPVPLLMLHSAAPDKHAIKHLQPGKSLKFVPPTSLPDDLAWASGNADVASAFAGLALIVEHAGGRGLSEEVRSLVGEYIQSWNGESMGHEYAWVDEAIQPLDQLSHAAARLALETALSVRVQPEAVDEFRMHFPADSQLIAATAWASFTAARRAGVWLTNEGGERK